MMTRAYAIGSPLINAALHYTGIGFAFLFGVLWFDEADLGDGAGRHRADRRRWRVGDPAARAAGAAAARRAARSALTMPAWTCTAP